MQHTVPLHGVDVAAKSYTLGNRAVVLARQQRRATPGQAC